MDVTWEHRDDHVGVITLDRPDARNALTFAMYAELERLVRAAAGEGVRCLVVTGSDPAFCSGDDVRQVMGGGNKDVVVSAPSQTADARRASRPQPTRCSTAMSLSSQPPTALRSDGAWSSR